MEGATVRCLEERPHLEETIEEIVALDEDGPWTFEDLDSDSGNFGYLVSRPFVEKVDSGYRLVDREATRRALKREVPDEDKSDGEGSSSASLQISGIVERVRSYASNSNFGFWGSLTVTLLFLFVMRSVTYRSVFRGEHVVTTGNDSYHYRYWVDQLLAESPGVFSFGEIADVLGGRATGEPFAYVIGWWLTLLVDGSPETSGFAISWFPVVSSVIVGALTAWMALSVTGDERIAVLSVLSFAVIPSHGLYSSIGFFDHHAVDYLWLAIMAASLVWLARDLARKESGIDHVQNPWTWLVVALFGVTVTASMLSWNGAPLLLLGVALYAAARPISEIRTGDSPLVTSLPLLVGLGIAGILTHLMHTRAGWQEPVAVYAPVVVLVGAVGVSLVAEAADRYYPNPKAVLGGVIGVGLALLVGMRVLATELFTRYWDRFFDSLLGRSLAAETRPLISTDIGLLFGPIDHYGWWIFFAVPALVLVTWKCVDRHDPRWLVLASYAWALLSIALIQVRFIAELSPFAAIFAAVGIVWLFSALDLSASLSCFDKRVRQRARPIRNLTSVTQGVYIAFILVVIVALGIIVTTSAVGTLAITDSEYEAAAWIESDLDDRGDDQEEFVLSRWGRNRMYNYFAWGGGNSYGYARSNHVDFLSSEDPDEWYERFENRVGYIVIMDRGGEEAAEQGLQLTSYGQLFHEYGSATETMDGAAHFQMVYRTEFESKAVFRPVPGATIQGEAAPDATVTVATDVEVAGEEFEYTRRTHADDGGSYNVTVAYPGEYQVGDVGNVTITEDAVENGTTTQFP